MKFDAKELNRLVDYAWHTDTADHAIDAIVGREDVQKYNCLEFTVYCAYQMGHIIGIREERERRKKRAHK